MVINIRLVLLYNEGMNSCYTGIFNDGLYNEGMNSCYTGIFNDGGRYE